MPIALLLQEIADTFRLSERQGDINLVKAWERVLSLEMQLVGRARSAFLVYWFGPNLPLHDLKVRVAVHNFNALQERYRVVVKEMKEGERRRNIMEPVAGLAATMIGSLSSPITSIFLYERIHRIQQKWYTSVLATLNVITMGLLGTFLAVFATGIITVLTPFAPLSSNLESAHRLFGAVAEMIEPFRRFWRAVTGPRDKLRNPVLRAILMLGDQLANLFPFLMGAFSVLIMRVGRVLAPLAEQLPALFALVDAVLPAVNFVIEDFMERLKVLGEGKRSPFHILTIILGEMARLMPTLTKGFHEAFKIAGLFITRAVNRLTYEWDAWKYVAMPQIKSFTSKHPTVITMMALIDDVKTIIDVFGTPGSPPGTFGKMLLLLEPPDEARITARLGGEPTPLEEIMRIAKGEGGPLALYVNPTPFTLTKEAQLGLEVARHPPSVFSGERMAIAAELEKARSQDRLLAEADLRDLLFEVVARVMPPKAYDYVSKLESVFRQIDEKLGRELPVRDLPENNRLQPVVSRLRIRSSAPSKDEPALREWARQLVAALNGQTYSGPLTS